MADSKPTSNFYRNLGGVNQKASEYSVDKAQFFNIRNMDFDVPNALQKRPGSTQAISPNTSGPITSLHEFIKLDGTSYLVAGSDTAMFYMASGGLTLLSSGWSNGQPADMLTFVNKEWIANGQKFIGWSGVGATPAPAGALCPVNEAYTAAAAPPFTTSPTITGASFTVGGYRYQTWIGGAGATLALAKTAAFFAYSYVYSDGRLGPVDIRSTAKNVAQFLPTSNNVELLNESFIVSGVTIPSGQGITALALWVALDGFAYGGGSQLAGASVGLGALTVNAANFGYFYGGLADVTLSATATEDAILDNFRLYTIVPASTWGSTFNLYFTSFAGWKSDYTNNLAQNASLYVAGRPLRSFSLSSFCWFNTNTPKYIEVGNNVMFSSGFSNAPSTVWFSEIGQPETILEDSSFEVRTNDGDRVYALKAFNNELLVFKENSFYKVIGDSADTFQLVEVSLQYGCISNKAIVEFEQHVAFLDKQGVVVYNGASYDIISTPVEDIFRRMNLSAAKEKAVAVNHFYRRQIWFGIPIDGSTENNITVVYDYLVKAWTFFDGFNPSSFGFVKQGLTKPDVWRGNYSGMIYYHGQSFYGDNGQAITCLAVPHWDKNKENETWIWRRFFLDVDTASGLTGTISGKVFSNYSTNTVQATFSMYQNAFQSRAEIGVVGKAATVEFAHNSASLPLLINGYSWAKRYIRNV